MTLLAKLLERFKSSFEYRHTYVESFTDSAIATQIKVLREHQQLSQTALAERAGMRQSQISALEDVNNSSWTVSTLKKLARAFDLVLVVRFEEFGRVLPDIDAFGRTSLERRPFERDPIFAESKPIQQDGTAWTQVNTVATSSHRVLSFSRPESSQIAMAIKSTTPKSFFNNEAVAR